MKCMRCGTKIIAGSVFCEECLADMEKHPVKPGTPINLPHREKQVQPKRTKKRFHKPDEQIHTLRRLVIWLITLVIFLAIALSACIYMLVNQTNNHDGDRMPGQNYGTSVDGV